MIEEAYSCTMINMEVLMPNGSKHTVKYFFIFVFVKICLFVEDDILVNLPTK